MAVEKQHSGIKGVEVLRFQHRLEFWALRGLLKIMRFIGIDRASSFGSWLGRTIGPFTSAHKTAIGNLRAAFPEKPDAEIKEIVRGAWDNFGRTGVEFIFLDHLTPDHPDQRVEVVGYDLLPKYLEQEKSCIFISGHFANWELMAACIRKAGFTVAGVYRAPNNPLVNDWLLKERLGHHLDTLVPKGRQGARQLMELVKKGESIAMLVDQKMNDGVTAPFFGRPANTAGAAAQLAVKYGCPILPVYIERTEGARFRVTFHDAMELDLSGDKAKDIETVTAQYNKFLEDCIRQRPEQWLWMHNRWTHNPKKLAKAIKEGKVLPPDPA